MKLTFTRPGIAKGREANDDMADIACVVLDLVKEGDHVGAMRVRLRFANFRESEAIIRIE